MSVPAGISGSGRRELARVAGGGRRRLVSVADVAKALEVDRTTAAKRLARWTDQGWMRRVRRGLYIPVPLDAKNPATWSEDPLVLADAVWAPCYFSGWTAANHWGLTEQIFRRTVLKTTNRVRSVHERLLDYEYLLAHVREHAMTWGLKRVWRDERRVQVADAARTVIDVLDDPRLGAGIRHCAEILEEYLEDHAWDSLVEYGDRLGNRTVFKRLGYLLEATGRSDEARLKQCEVRVSAGISLLDPSAPTAGRRIARWGLRANAEVGARGAS
jgi:predicted transcriptional regulator of viral defense system